MGNVQKGTEERRLTDADLRELVLEFTARTGIEPWDYTFGEIFWMVRHCKEHEQMMMACAAQSAEMWPKSSQNKPSQKKAVDAKLSALFDRK